MSVDVSIRPARGSDLEAINEIYNHYVIHSTCTFQTAPETMKARESWFAAHGVDHPIFVAEYGGKMAGWASLSRFHPRAAYRYTVEDSVYVHPDLLGMGIGTLLLMKLIEAAERPGHHSIVALIAADQAGSLRVHEKLGFTVAGTLKQAGMKFNKWVDVIYMQRMV
jgi:L-amino acid N-acyltransferase YncA